MHIIRHKRTIKLPVHTCTQDDRGTFETELQPPSRHSAGFRWPHLRDTSQVMRQVVTFCSVIRCLPGNELRPVLTQSSQHALPLVHANYSIPSRGLRARARAKNDDSIQRERLISVKADSLRRLRCDHYYSRIFSPRLKWRPRLARASDIFIRIGFN